MLVSHTPGHPRHWPRNSLFGTVFDPLHERWIGGRRHFRAEQPLLPSDLQLANTSQASTGCCFLVRCAYDVNTCNQICWPAQPKGLPSSSAARLSDLENSALEDAVDILPPVSQQSNSQG
ncbi:hypothetical protein HaLaN_15014, partial [Haematococcus lacustris]